MTPPTPSSPAPRPLSDAAQNVWDAWNDAYEAQGPLEDMGVPIAAALRAVADQAKENRYITGRWISDAELRSLADELEGQ